MKFGLYILIIFSLLSCAKKLETENKKHLATPSNRESESFDNSSELQKQLKLAIEKSSYNLVRYALKQGADANCIYFGNESALTYSIKKDQSAITRLLVNYGANPNQANLLNEYPLHLSVEYANIAAANILLNDQQTNKDQKDSNGETAIIKALQIKDRQLALLLASKKVSLQLRSSQDEFVEEIAFNNFDTDFSNLLKDLRNYQADYTKFIALKSIMLNNRKTSLLYIRNIYWDEKAELNSQILEVALETKNEKLRSFYIDSLFKIANFKDKDLNEAMLYAAKIDDLTSFKNIYANLNNYDPNYKDANDRTALTYAAENLNYQFAYYLRDKGADTYFENKKNEITNTCHFIKRKRVSRRYIRNFKRLLGC